MADKKISQLTGASTPLAGTEVLPVVQNSTTVKVSVDNLTAGKTVSALKFYATSTDTIPLEARRTVANNTCLSQLVDSPSTSNCNYLITGIDTTGGSIGYASGGAFVSTGANGTGTARSLILHTYGNNDIVFARQNTQVGSVSANGFKPIATKGVDFSANTPAAGMTSQLLNLYEEGTWTPTITAGSGSITAYTSAGYYTRIGRQVFLNGTISISNNGTGGTSVDIGSLPFAISGGVAGGIARENQVNGATSSITASGANTLVMFKYDNTYPAGSGTAFQFSVTYFV